MRHLAIALGLAIAIATPAAAQSPAAQVIRVQTDTMEPVGFAALVSTQQGFTSDLAPTKVRAAVLDALAQAGHDAVGHEDVIFGSDRTSQARFLLGGTVLEGRCIYGYGTTHCQAQVRWELFDQRSGQVVYRVRTRGEVQDASGTVTHHHAYQVVLSSLHSAMAREAFVDTLRRHPVSTGTAAPPQWPDELQIRACEAAPVSLPADMDDVMASVLLVRTPAGVGSAVVISADGFALTAAHVVELHSEVDVATPKGTKLIARVVRIEPEHDLALLALPGRGHPCRALAAEPPPIASPIFAIGAPGGEAMAFSVASGIVSAHRRLWGRDFLQTDAGLNPGNSGGPLLDGQGSIAGIVSFKIAAPGFQGLGFGVPAAAVASQLGLRLGSTSSRSLVGFSLRAPSAGPSDGALIDWPDADVDIPEHSPTNSTQSSTTQRDPDMDPMARMLFNTGTTLIATGITVTLFGHMIAQQPQGHRNAWIIGGTTTGFGVVALIVGLAIKTKSQRDRKNASDLLLVPGPNSLHLLGSF